MFCEIKQKSIDKRQVLYRSIHYTLFVSDAMVEKDVAQSVYFLHWVVAKIIEI